MRRTTLAALAAIAVLPLAALVATQRPDAQEEAAPGAPDRAATEAIIRDYLIENPEVIIEALERWRAQQESMAAMQSEDAARQNLALLRSGELGYAMGAGEAEAEVLVVEFFDYHCGYCRRAADFVFELADEEGVRVVLQDMPILREESRLAALAGLSAAQGGDYPALHRALFRTSGVLDAEAVRGAARRAGLRRPNEAIPEGDEREALEAKLERSLDVARAMGLDGTPTFVVASPDGAYLEVIPSYAPEAVEAAIARARES